MKNIQQRVQTELNSVEPIATTTTGSGITTNNTPNTAMPISIGTVYDNFIVSEGEQKWYAFKNTSSGKLTVYMQALQNQNISYNLHLFKYNEQTNGLDPVVSSTYPATINQQLSAIGNNNSLCFIAVNSVKGFDDKNSFKFIVNYSSKYGNNEPDDNILQGKPYKNTLSMIDFIDNVFDEDWCTFQVDEDTNYSLLLENLSIKGKYKADIINANLNILATIDQNKVSKITFPKGEYYIRISALSGFDADVSYRFNIDILDSIVTQATIYKISSDGGVEGFMDYGSGKKWRIQSNIVVEGIAYNQFGKPVDYYQFDGFINGIEGLSKEQTAAFKNSVLTATESQTNHKYETTYPMSLPQTNFELKFISKNLIPEKYQEGFNSIVEKYTEGLSKDFNAACEAAALSEINTKDPGLINSGCRERGYEMLKSVQNDTYIEQLTTKIYSKLYKNIENSNSIDAKNNLDPIFNDIIKNGVTYNKGSATEQGIANDVKFLKEKWNSIVYAMGNYKHLMFKTSINELA